MQIAHITNFDVDPLDWFAAEHERQRRMLGRLRDLASSASRDTKELEAATAFLEADLPRHLAEEETHLLPLLARRALPDDGAAEVLQRLHQEHRRDLAQARALAADLRTCLAAGNALGLDPALGAALATFASHELAHLALENAVVLPLCRRRLNGRDLARLRRDLTEAQRPSP